MDDDGVGGSSGGNLGRSSRSVSFQVESEGEDGGGTLTTRTRPAVGMEESVLHNVFEEC